MKKIRSFVALADLITATYPTVTLKKKDDCFLLEGHLASWKDIVAVGYMAAKIPSGGVINRITLEGYTETPIHASMLRDQAYEGLAPEVLVIGGGVVGCAILRELTKYRVNAVLVEKENDVALQASSHNDGCIHVGADLHPDSLKYKYLRKAVPMYETLSRQLHFDYRQTGQTILVKEGWMRLLTPLARLKFARRGNADMEIWNRKKILQHIPHAPKDIKFAFFFPKAAVVSPYNVTIAYAENALQNGAKILLNTTVESMDVTAHTITAVHTNRGTLYPKVVINAAGVFADRIAAMADDQFFSIHPREGLDIILDKKAKPKLGDTTFSLYGATKQIDESHSKGGGIIPTVDGNVLVGPDAHEVPEREHFVTDPAGFRTVFDKQRIVAPIMNQGDVITYFKGTRAPTYEEDFIVRPGKWTHNIVHAAGIQSPGLTAAPAIAVDIVRYAAYMLGGLPLNPSFQPIREVAPILNELPSEKRDALIRQNPDYGQIVCRCETISKGEIIDCLHRPLPPQTIDGVKRRIRPGMGRCQGGFCQPLVAQLMAQEYHLPLEKIYKKGEGPIVVGNTKG